MPNDLVIKGTTVFSTHGQRPKTVEERRLCAAEDCITVLSTYNKDALCWFHRPRRKPRVRGREIPDNLRKGTKTCRSCSARASSWDIEADTIELNGYVHREGYLQETLCKET